MTKRYFDLLEELDDFIACKIDELEDELQNQLDDEDVENGNDFIEELEHIRGIINE
ncbi:hypothetical protein MNB_SM-5-479 [hydrothermal vent metagenome]|uniref:Uncharacterized protein n=1 Tax=hydrothermal vent metagenome TaxID=652676 RepID=A0A1W1CYJ6_9ZZZZ